MHLVGINRAGIETCYQLGMVKPNEFRQVFMNILQKELQLRLEAATVSDLLRTLFSKRNYFIALYQNLSECEDDIVQCIISLASSAPNKLLIEEEEAKKLFLSYIFHRKALLVRDCSDIFKHDLVESPTILVDKETLRAIEYLSTYTTGGKALLKDLLEYGEV